MVTGLAFFFLYGKENSGFLTTPSQIAGDNPKDWKRSDGLVHIRNSPMAF